MGVKDDIRWLEEVDERFDLFIKIAKSDSSDVRELKDFLGSDDWWPVKYHVKELADRDLVMEGDEGGYQITEEGKKVFESLETVTGIESV